MQQALNEEVFLFKNQLEYPLFGSSFYSLSEDKFIFDTNVFFISIHRYFKIYLIDNHSKTSARNF